MLQLKHIRQKHQSIRRTLVNHPVHHRNHAQTSSPSQLIIQYTQTKALLQNGHVPLPLLHFSHCSQETKNTRWPHDRNNESLEKKESKKLNFLADSSFGVESKELHSLDKGDTKNQLHLTLVKKRDWHWILQKILRCLRQNIRKQSCKRLINLQLYIWNFRDHPELKL